MKDWLKSRGNGRVTPDSDRNKCDKAMDDGLGRGAVGCAQPPGVGEGSEGVRGAPDADGDKSLGAGA